jgi:hypothetical protein
MQQEQAAPLGVRAFQYVRVLVHSGCSTFLHLKAPRELLQGFFFEAGTIGRSCTSYVCDTGEETVMLQTTPKQELKAHQDAGFLKTFDPDVPGYVFWLVMLIMIAFHQLVLHVR